MLLRSSGKTAALLVLLTLLAAGLQAFGPTITQNGTWQSISSFQVIQARINDQNEQVCLPRIMFKDEVDQNLLKEQIKKGIPSQEAIFHLYHDGLGSPKKQGGMYYASDVFLKDMKVTYTGFLRKLGYDFKVSSTPAFEDKEFMRDVLYSRHINTAMTAQQEADKKNGGKSGEKPVAAPNKSTMRVTTIFDVLPAGVIPPRIRAQQEEIARRVNALKGRPYETEIVQIDPLRWAAGRMGLIREDGTISGANVEGQKPELMIRVPAIAGWLNADMIKELNGQPCEFVLQRNGMGLEVVDNGRYLLRDIYFNNLKLSWEEWLQKHSQICPEFVEKPEYATGTIPLEVKLVSGKWEAMKAPVLCEITFARSTPLNGPRELFRVFPPDPRPKDFAAFATKFNGIFKGRDADISILVCPDGKPYHEIGQKRARRIYFPDEKNTLDMLQNAVMTGQFK